MTAVPNPDLRQKHAGFLGRLLHDRSGNTMAMVAASITPLLALVGGGIDMGRSYLSESRLQQACDAGVLAARKKLGSSAIVDGTVPADVALVGNKFFNINFRAGAYGTENRSFVMTLENDYSISGTASVQVPTTIMKIFGNDFIPVTTNCQAALNFANTDVMMVLDTTGSMSWKLAGETLSKIETLRNVVKAFHAQLEGFKAPGTRVRYGFVPYSTNVNVGYLLKSGWMVDEWDYNGRVTKPDGKTKVTKYIETKTTVSGSYAEITPYKAPSCLPSNVTTTSLSYSVSSSGVISGRTKVNGSYYSCDYDPDAGEVTINGTTYTDYIYDWTKTPDGTKDIDAYKWQYRDISVDVSPFKGATDNDVMVGGSILLPLSGSPSAYPSLVSLDFTGCIEERDTYEISDYDNVDLSKALDLDIDLTPDPTDADTQWRPMLHYLSFERDLDAYANGDFKSSTVTTKNDLFNAYDNVWNSNYTRCPSKAQKLKEMTATEVKNYVNGLVAAGSTYHDIGMIWGGRLLSPTGIFADENVDIDGKATSRHLVFLTDGATAPLDLSYASYGVEPIDKRRWDEGSKMTLTETVEARFSFACEEVKKKNITVWVIGFGTSVTDMLKECAGDGHWFQADDSSELNSAFNTIAQSMGDLRITK